MSDENKKANEYGHQQLALRMRDYISTSRQSQSSAAAKIGVSGTTLSRWLTGEYGADTGRVDELVAKFLSHQHERLQSAVRTIAFVETPSALKIIKILTHAQVAGDIVFVHGIPGVSKTSACLEYAKRHPQVWHATMSQSTKGVVTCLEEICEAVGVSVVGRGAAHMHRSLVKHVRDTDGLLIIDEVQHVSLDALEQIRALHDATGIGVALVGNDGAWLQLTSGAKAEKLDRLHSRVGRRLKLGKPKSEDIEPIIDAWGAPSDCRKRLRDIASESGGIRRLCKTLRLASRLAASQRAELCCEHIEAAYVDMSGVD